MTTEQLARFMFDRQADAYDAVGPLRAMAWADKRVRRFWMGEAAAILVFLGDGGKCGAERPGTSSVRCDRPHGHGKDHRNGDSGRTWR